MKKQLMCLLLVLCTVLALFPVITAPASAAQANNDYDSLYVKDGLKIWLDGFDSSNPNIKLDEGKWYSEVGDAYATIQSSSAFPWEKRAGGGVGWTQIGALSDALHPNALVFDNSLIPTGSWTVDMAITADGITNADGTRYVDDYVANVSGHMYGICTGETFAVGTFKSMTFVTLHTAAGKPSSDSLGNRWYYTGMVYNNHTTALNGKVGMQVSNTESGIQQYAVGEMFSMVMRFDRLSDVAAKAAVLYSGMPTVQADITPEKINSKDGKLLANDAGFNAAYESAPGNVLFRLMYALPGTVYAVRVYDRALSDSEIRQNAFADLCTLHQLDISPYADLPEKAKKSMILELLAEGSDAEKTTLQSIIDNAEKKAAEEEAANAGLKAELDARGDYDKYYVKDGLTVWLDAFVSMDGYNDTIDLEKGTWKSKVGEVTATLGNSTQWKSYDGYGIGYTMTKSEWQSGGQQLGVFLDAKLLPVDSGWTVETVWNPVGLTNEDGTLYTDPADSPSIWGLYTNAYSAFSFGPFKAMAFVSDSKAQNAVGISFRWCYTQKEWNAHNGGDGYTEEISIRNATAPIGYTIAKNKVNSEADHYTIYNNMLTVLSKGVTVINDPNPEFELMHGFPGVIYAARLYNRRLTDLERSQNHVADLMNYYGLDTAFYDMVLAGIGDKSDFYPLFDDMDFSLERKDAQAEFQNRIANAWFDYNGIAGRLDDIAGIRAEYTMNENAIRILQEGGYQVEVGILLNVTKAGAPTLEDAEYKFVLRENDGSINEQLVLRSENGVYTAAVAVMFHNPTTAMYTEVLDFNGYMILSKPGSESMLLYIHSISPSCESTLFSLYSHLGNSEDHSANAFVSQVIDNSFDRVEVKIDAENGNDQNNGTDAPVKTIARAYELLLELLNHDAPVDITLRFAAGTYVTEEILELDASKVGQKYFRLNYVGVAAEEGASTISTALPIDAAKFTKVDGKDYYLYQFEKNAAGAYPDFRFLYVNGVAATMAHRGFTRTYDAEMAALQDPTKGMYRNKYELFCDASGNKDTSRGYMLYLPLELFEDLTEEDYYKLEYHMPIAWYYRTMHITHIDPADTVVNKEDGKTYVAAYFASAEASKWSAAHGAKKHYFWLENCLSFVDEPGEYYYDDQNGKLYYYPAEDVDMTTATFEYPTGDYMLTFINCTNVNFENIHFTGNDCYEMEGQAYMGGQATTPSGAYGANTVAAVYAKNPTNFKFYGCTFHDLASSGIKVCGRNQKLTVESCRFENIGSSAMDIGHHNGGWNEESNANINVLVTDNYLHNIATHMRNSVALYVGVAKNIEISYNTISHTSYSAVSIGWRWSSVSWELGEDWHIYNADIYCNYFESFMTDQSDGAGVYTLGGNVQTTYREHFNYLHDNYVYVTKYSWDGQGMVMPLYHDEGSSNWHTYNNVEVACPGRNLHTPMYLQNIGGKSNNILVEDNFFLAALKDWETYSGGEELTELQKERLLFGLDGTRLMGIQPDGLFTHPTRVEEARGLYQQNNQLYDHPAHLPDEALEIIAAAGSSMMPPDAEAMLDDMYTAYDAHYEKLEQDYINQWN